MSIRDEIAEATMYQISGLDIDAVLDHLTERGMVVLGPDGEPMRLRRYISPSSANQFIYEAVAAAEEDQ